MRDPDAPGQKRIDDLAERLFAGAWAQASEDPHPGRLAEAAFQAAEWFLATRSARYP